MHDIAGAEELASGGDADMRDLAREELKALVARRDALIADMKILLIPKDPNDEKNVMLEIRAGTGGDEAALFAADLFSMYSMYAERQGWRLEVMSSNDTGVGGLKEVIAMIEGRGAYSKLKYESGVHRVQRVPATEASGRIHTSTVTVAVLAWWRARAARGARRSRISACCRRRALDHRDDFLQAADAGVAARHHIEAPAMAFRVHAVHAEQIRREQCRFVAAGAGADLEHDVLFVVGILRDSRIFMSAMSASRRATRDLSSSLARSRMSASPPLASSSAPVMSCTTVLYSRKRWISGSTSASALACFRYSCGSACTSLVPSSRISSS